MIAQAQITAEFTDLPALREQFARLAPGASLVFCRGPGSWARFPHPSAAQVQAWIDGGIAVVAFGRDPRDGSRWLHRVYRKDTPTPPAPDALPLRSALAFEASAEGRVWALLRDCAAEGQPCPTNEQIAIALDLETARDARGLFDKLKAQGRIRVVSAAQFSHRVIEVVLPGEREPLRTAPCGGAK